MKERVAGTNGRTEPIVAFRQEDKEKMVSRLLGLSCGRKKGRKRRTVN